MADKKTVRIFTMEQKFPCGPDSSCCGPIGQSEEEISNLKRAIEKHGAEVEIYDVTKADTVQQFQNVFALLRSYGMGIVPILTVDDQVVSMGSPSPEEVVSAIKPHLPR